MRARGAGGGVIRGEYCTLFEWVGYGIMGYLEENRMTDSAKNIIESFDELPDTEKQEVARAILRRALHLDMPPLTDADLVLQAEELFLDLEKREAADEQS